MRHASHDPESAPALDAETAQRLRADAVAFLSCRSGDPALAEDLAHEVLLRVLRGLPSFRGDAALRTWARRIAVNVWHDHLRERQRRDRRLQLSAPATLDALPPPSPARLAEAAHDGRRTSECLGAAARRLPEDARRAVELRYFDDRTLEELAGELGCSLGAAKVRVHRARKRLGEICREDCVTETGSEGDLVCTPRVAPEERRE